MIAVEWQLSLSDNSDYIINPNHFSANKEKVTHTHSFNDTDFFFFFGQQTCLYFSYLMETLDLSWEFINNYLRWKLPNDWCSICIQNFRSVRPNSANYKHKDLIDLWKLKCIVIPILWFFVLAKCFSHI